MFEFLQLVLIDVACALIFQVSSIKCGMWDSMYDTSQSIGQHELSRTSTDKYSEYLNTDVEPNIKDAPPVITEHVTQHTQSE